MNSLSCISARNYSGKSSNGFLNTTAKHGGDVYPFHSLKPGRTINFDDYRFGGSNGQEADDEIMGTGNIYTAEFWQYDSRLGRRWNRDPKRNPSISEYATFANNPIWFTDVYGDTVTAPNGKKYHEGEGYKATEDGKYLYGDGLQTKVWDPDYTGTQSDIDGGGYVNYDGEIPGISGASKSPDKTFSSNKVNSFQHTGFNFIGSYLFRHYAQKHVVGVYGEASWWLWVGGQDWGVVHTEFEGFNGYYSEKLGIRSEAASIGVGVGVLWYPGDKKNFDFEQFRGGFREFDINASIAVVDAGLVIVRSKEKDAHNHYLYIIGGQISAGAATPYISGGYSSGNTELLTE